MRSLRVACVVAAWIAVGIGGLGLGTREAVARPTVVITGIDVDGDSVGVDVEAVGIARELTRALRRTAGRDGAPLQLIDPMVNADDVEAIVWGKLIRDGDAWIVTTHLSAVGAEGDTVSYRETIPHNATSSSALQLWGRVIYDALIEQLDFTADGEDVKIAKPPVTPIATSLTNASAGAGANADVFAVRDPVPIADSAPDDVFSDRAPSTAVATVDDDTIPEFRAGRDPSTRPDVDSETTANNRRLFYISAGVAAAGAVLWTVAGIQVNDAEDQIDRLEGCSNCDRAITAANAQGNRWEGISWLAGTATVAGIAASCLFGYQAFVAGRKAGPHELVGDRGRARHDGLTVAPILGPDRVGAGVTVPF